MSTEAFLKDMRRTIARDMLMDKNSTDTERLRQELRKLCRHPQKFVFQAPSGGYPSTYTRICAGCGTEERASAEYAFKVLQSMTSVISWGTMEKLRIFDIMTMKEIDPSLI